MADQRKHLPIALAVTSVLAALFLFTTATPARAESAPRPAEMCSRVIAVAEKGFGLPAQLLAAIARAESGRWISERQANFAWPWTVTVEGDGHYYERKSDAVAAVRRFHQHGIKNIDVGCLQINLQYHPRAFRSLEAAFDPMENTIYAARLLKSLYESSRSWTDAVALYHSANPSARYPYVAKVSQLWYDEHKRANLAIIEARRERLLAMLRGSGGPAGDDDLE